jgi:acetyl-CoA C-acetyltransferase
MLHDGLWCAWEGHHMGNSAEAIAARHEVTREAQDAWSLRSHQRAAAAIERGDFREEIVPVELAERRPGGGGESSRLAGRRGPTVIDTDECPRPDTSAAALAALRPVFAKDGTVTAGNASGIADGAAALVLTSGRRAAEWGLRPLARYVASANAALDPLWLFQAPVPTIERLLQRTETTLDDYDLIELNEAFAAQMVADGKQLGWDEGRVNVNGGAIALGHPLGCSGARLLTTLLYALRARDGRRGIGAACLGGGEAFAVAVEALP